MIDTIEIPFTTHNGSLLLEFTEQGTFDDLTLYTVIEGVKHTDKPVKGLESILVNLRAMAPMSEPCQTMLGRIHSRWPGTRNA